MFDSFRNLFESKKSSENKPKLTAEQRLLNLQKRLKPLRKNPDLTNPLANRALSEIANRKLPYDLENMVYLETAFYDLHNLLQSQKINLEQFVTPESDNFKLFVKNIKAFNPDYYQIVLGLDRKSKNISKIEIEIYQNLTLFNPLF